MDNLFNKLSKVTEVDAAELVKTNDYVRFETEGGIIKQGDIQIIVDKIYVIPDGSNNPVPLGNGKILQILQRGGRAYKGDSVGEDTTSDDIAYAPGPIKPATPAARALLRDKSRIKNKEAEKKALDKDKEIDKMAEALVSRMPIYKDAIINEIDKAIKNSKLNIREFRRAFPRAHDITQKSVLIRDSNIRADEDALKAILPDDPGELQLVLSSLERKDAVTIKQFNKFLYLYGVRLISRLYGDQYGDSILYTGYMDTTFTEKELLYVKSVDLLDAIDRLNLGKVVGQTVYPSGGVFPRGFFDALKEVIDNMDKEDEHE